MMNFDRIEEVASVKCVEKIKEEFGKYSIENAIYDIEEVKSACDDFVKISFLGTDFWDNRHITIVTYTSDDYFGIETVRLGLVELANDFLKKL